MAPPHQQQHPFWSFVDPSQAHGRGVDNYANSPFAEGFPFGSDFPFGGGRGGHGRRGRHHGHRGHHHGRRGEQAPWGFPFGGPLWFYEDDEEEQQPQQGTSSRQEKPTDGDDATMADGETVNEKQKEREKSSTLDNDVPDPAEVTPDSDEDDGAHPPPYGPEAFFGGFRGRRGCGRGGRGRGGACRGRRGGPSAPHTGPYDFSGLMRGLGPFLQSVGAAAEQYSGTNDSDDADTFTPPTDIFNTEQAYVLHVSLPGAKKEDVGVNWNPDSGILSVSGVVHRPGDEAFLQTLHKGERRVGVFERKVTIPPPGVSADKEDIDVDAITARMEDGVLIVTVPKTEKEWTEIRKVDIE